MEIFFASEEIIENVKKCDESLWEDIENDKNIEIVLFDPNTQKTKTTWDYVNECYVYEIIYFREADKKMVRIYPKKL